MILVARRWKPADERTSPETCRDDHLELAQLPRQCPSE